MKFIFTQIVLLSLGVTMLLYLMSLNSFVPFFEGGVDWYNLTTILLLLFTTIQAVVSLPIFLFQKFSLFEKGEFPKPHIALKWGIGVGICLIISLLLSIYSIIPLAFGFTALIIVLVILNLMFV